MRKSVLKRFKLAILMKRTLIFGFTILTLFVLVTGQSSHAPQSKSSNQPGYNSSAKPNAQIPVTTPQADVVAKQDSSQKTPATQPNKSAQNQSYCVRNDIPYKTTYQDAPYLQKGQTQESGGTDGFSTYCGNEKPFVANPVDKTIFVGTGLTDAEIQQQQIAAQQALDAKQHRWDITYANAYQNCTTYFNSINYSGGGNCSEQASQQAGPYPQ